MLYGTEKCVALVNPISISQYICDNNIDRKWTWGSPLDRLGRGQLPQQIITDLEGRDVSVERDKDGIDVREILRT